MKEAIVVTRPAFSAGFEKIESPFDVGSNELARAEDASVDVAFRCEVDDQIRVELIEHHVRHRPCR